MFSDNFLSKYSTIVWFETRTFVSNFGFKLGLKPKLKRHFMFHLNFGFKPVLVSNQGFKLWFKYAKYENIML